MISRVIVFRTESLDSPRGWLSFDLCFSFLVGSFGLLPYSYDMFTLQLQVSYKFPKDGDIGRWLTELTALPDLSTTVTICINCAAMPVGPDMVLLLDEPFLRLADAAA